MSFPLLIGSSSSSIATAQAARTEASETDETAYIDELMYSISTLRRFQELAPTQPNHCDERIKKHLNLLDGIALLLVTDSHSDVVATSYIQTDNRITINVARNSAAKISSDYIAKILNRLSLITVSDDRNIAAVNVLLIALKPCFPKIRQRTMKLWNACKKLLPQEVNEENMDQFIQGLYLEREGVQSPQVVAEFFTQLKSFSEELRPVTEKLDRASWAVFLRKAYQVAKLELFATITPYTDIRRRTAKLGDYFQACLRIVVTCLSPDVRRYQGAIFVEQIPTTSQVLAPVRNPLKVLNHHRNPGEREISAELFKLAYPSGPLHANPIKITASVHCELTVAMHMIKGSNVDSSPIEIGVSKHCCHMCGVFIKEINKISRKQLVVSGLQGKAQAGWRFPPETPLCVQRAITKLARKEIDELRCYADTKRRSDSFPTEDSGDEERADYREIDMSVHFVKDFDEC